MQKEAKPIDGLDSFSPLPAGLTPYMTGNQYKSI
jgi:hypothetical protein